MSKPTQKEYEYLEALGYIKPTTISKTNKPLIKKLIEAEVPIDAIKRHASKHNYKDLPNEESKKNSKSKFIDKLIKQYGEIIQDVEFISDEDVFIDSQERILNPKPNPKPNTNLNILETKMSKNKLKISKDAERFNYMNYEPDELDEIAIENIMGGKKSKSANKWITKDHPYFNTKTEYDPRMINPNYAAYRASKKGGKAYIGDFNQDGVGDVVVTNKHGVVKYINGHSRHETEHPMMMDYFASQDYQKLSHKTKSGKEISVFNRKNYKEWIDTVDNTTKNEAKRLLRDSGVTGFTVKDEKVTNLLKNNASIVYDNMINGFKEDFSSDEIKEIKKHLSKATFANRIVNAILLAVSGLDKENIKNDDLQFYLNKLNKSFNKDKDKKQEILDLGNQVLEASSKLAYDPEFGMAVFNVASKPHSLASYKTIINLLKQAKDIAKNDDYRLVITKQNGELLKKPAKKGEGKSRKPTRTKEQYNADRKAAKKAKLQAQLAQLQG